MSLRKWYLLLVALIVMGSAKAALVEVDFDSLSDGDALSNQLSGLAFTNAEVLSAGLSLNEFEFPPRSDANVVTDVGGAVLVDFLSPVFAVGGYFTYLTPLSFSAYDSAHALIGSVVSAYSNNLAISGDPGSSPNEFLGVATTVPIYQIMILGDPFGFSFVMDDLTYNTERAVRDVSEPWVLYLLLTALGMLAMTKHRRDSWGPGYSG